MNNCAKDVLQRGSKLLKRYDLLNRGIEHLGLHSKAPTIISTVSLIVVFLRVKMYAIEARRVI